MRPFSPRMFRHRARVRAAAEVAGRSGGVAETLGDPGPELPCRVRVSGERQGFAAAGEVAVARAQVAFPADPGVALGDRLVCGPAEYRALGPARARDAEGVLFVVECEVVE